MKQTAWILLPLLLASTPAQAFLFCPLGKQDQARQQQPRPPLPRNAPRFAFRPPPPPSQPPVDGYLGRNKARQATPSTPPTPPRWRPDK